MAGEKSPVRGVPPTVDGKAVLPKIGPEKSPRPRKFLAEVVESLWTSGGRHRDGRASLNNALIVANRFRDVSETEHGMVKGLLRSCEGEPVYTEGLHLLEAVYYLYADKPNTRLARNHLDHAMEAHEKSTRQPGRDLAFSLHRTGSKNRYTSSDTGTGHLSGESLATIVNTAINEFVEEKTIEIKPPQRQF